MTKTTLLRTAALVLIFGIAAPAYAQEQHEQDQRVPSSNDMRDGWS